MQPYLTRAARITVARGWTPVGFDPNARKYRVYCGLAPVLKCVVFSVATQLICLFGVYRVYQESASDMHYAYASALVGVLLATALEKYGISRLLVWLYLLTMATLVGVLLFLVFALLTGSLPTESYHVYAKMPFLPEYKLLNKYLGVHARLPEGEEYAAAQDSPGFMLVTSAVVTFTLLVLANPIIQYSAYLADKLDAERRERAAHADGSV